MPRDIQTVLREHTDRFMKIAGVVGVGRGEHQDKPCIKVLVVAKTPTLQKQLPDHIEGYPVIMEESGTCSRFMIHHTPALVVQCAFGSENRRVPRRCITANGSTGVFAVVHEPNQLLRK